MSPPEPQEVRRMPRSNKALDKVKHYGWKMTDDIGVLYYAKKTELQIDQSYQRSIISEPRVLSIASNWSWVSFGCLIISERPDKTLWVVDGQHRLVASMRRSDVTELPCLVFKCDSAEEEAKAFYSANCLRGNVSAYDKLRALLVSGDQLAKDSVALIQSENYEPAATDRPGSIRCVARFISLMKSDRGILQKIWPLVARLHRDENNQPIRVRVLSALIYIGKFGTGDITSDVWRERIIRTGLPAITAAIDRACVVFVKGGSRVCAQGALEVINKGVRSGKIELSSGEDD